MTAGRTAIFAGFAALALAGCDSMPSFGIGITEKKLEGTRISVLSLERDLTPDPRLSRTEVKLPAPYRNAEWSQAGGVPTHAMYHLRVDSEVLQEVWRSGVGAGSGRDTRLLVAPVVADGRVYIIDAEGTLRALSAKDGGSLWSADLVPEDEDDEEGPGGGLAVYRGKVVATTGFGNVTVFDAANGQQVWAKSLPTPIRAAPTVSNDLIFAITFDNKLHVLALADGTEVWSHEGIAEDASVLGGAAAAVIDGLVMVPYSSGELVALKITTGDLVWSDTLSKRSALNAVRSIADIRALPVVDRGLVYAVSHSGRTGAIDVETGTRKWDIDVGGVETPWVAGDFVYMVTDQGEAICLTREDGRIRWVTQLQRFEDEEDKQGAVHWAGPVLVSDRLILVSSLGQAWALSPYSGEILGSLDLPDAIYLAPIVADGMVFILTDNAELVALR